jgi:ABC-2 type transport system ATP-binding protein
MPNATPAIEIEGLTKTFPGLPQPALDSLSGTIRSGIISGLVGPDGAGKSTLMRLMAGLLSPSAGTVKVLGLNPTDDAATLRSKVGYMPQKFGLYEDLSVLENLTLHADLRNVVDEARTQAFAELLKFTDLARFTDRFAGKLSGGMKQKLGLACALLGSPEVLLLDEPSVGVDPISRRELWRMVQALAGEGMAVVWSTAYLDEAELCEEVLLLNQGKFLFTGRPRDLNEKLTQRCFQIRNIEGDKRKVLARALRHPDIIDGVIQGHNVRFLTKEGRPAPEPSSFEAGSQATCVPVKPNFEDAFIDFLGGGPGGDSVLSQHIQPIERDGKVIIEAIDLTKTFGEFKATDRVNFGVQRGEIFGLLGPNGAGKSTTFKMMCGLLVPTSGSAKVMGLDLKNSASQARQRLGYMAQKFSLYNNLNVKQNLSFFSGAYGLSGTSQREMIEEMVEIFHLQGVLNTSTNSLSLGYKQRLALACAIMHQPDILFLDEPTSGVDPVTRREFWTHINAMVEKGVTIMVTTHFMDEAEYCDRIGLVFRGRLIACGTPDELKHQSRTEKIPDPSMEDAFINLVLAQTEKT